MKKTYVQPYWPQLLFGLCGTIIPVVLYINSTTADFSDIENIIILGTIIVMESSVSYVLSSKGILVFWLFIPIRLIRWHNVSSAMYLHHWTVWQSYNKAKGSGIMINLSPSLSFDPERDAVRKFTSKHPFKSMFVRFTKWNRDTCVKAFREYYPELTFQEGSEIFTEDP